MKGHGRTHTTFCSARTYWERYASKWTEQSKPVLVLFVILVPFPLDIHREVRWLDHVVVLFLIF